MICLCVKALAIIQMLVQTIASVNLTYMNLQIGIYDT